MTVFVAAIGIAAFVLAAAALYCAWNAKRHAIQASRHIEKLAWYLDLEQLPPTGHSYRYRLNEKGWP